ncbi:acyl-coenzyme A thioesterase 13-like [Gigantopelta aegis]|uniref:acyl-coenzyme A thioesterase 13-like n=1 Tax=Gigantopelta aegis TaxID=1735272 RepID=UPI001B889B45|nr:acyl-coenzyme A thioesterase 13-like [Gigantopelta aegis]
MLKAVCGPDYSLIKVVDGAEGKCVCELAVTQELTNVRGMLHGGTTALLVDSISTMALLTKTDNIPGVSVNMNISYIKSAPLGSEIVVNAQTLHVGRKLAFLTVDITNKVDGSLIAQGTHTKYVGQTKS